MVSGEDKQLSQNWNSMQPPSMLYGQSNLLQAGASAIGTSQSDGFHSFAVTKVSVVEKTRSQPSHGQNICKLSLKHNGPTSGISLAAELIRFKPGRFWPPLLAILLHNPNHPAALRPCHRLRIRRSHDHLAILGRIDLPVAGAVRHPEPGFADRPSKQMQEPVGKIDGGGGFHDTTDWLFRTSSIRNR